MFLLVLFTSHSDGISIQKNKLFKEGCILTDRDHRVYYVGEAMTTEAQGDWPHWIHSQKTEKIKSVLSLSLFSQFYLSASPANRMVAPTVRVSLPTSTQFGNALKFILRGLSPKLF